MNVGKFTCLMKRNKKAEFNPTFMVHRKTSEQQKANKLRKLLTSGIQCQFLKVNLQWIMIYYTFIGWCLILLKISPTWPSPPTPRSWDRDGRGLCCSAPAWNTRLRWHTSCRPPLTLDACICGHTHAKKEVRQSTKIGVVDTRQQANFV